SGTERLADTKLTIEIAKRPVFGGDIADVARAASRRADTIRRAVSKWKIPRYLRPFHGLRAARNVEKRRCQNPRGARPGEFRRVATGEQSSPRNLSRPPRAHPGALLSRA